MQEQPKDEQKATSCPKCGGNMLARGVYNYYGISFARNPKPNRFFPGPTSGMTGLVCDNCGYAEIYAEHPEKLRD